MLEKWEKSSQFKLSAEEEEWHLDKDGKKVADGIKLEEKIGNGAIIFQTSLDRERWTVNQVYADFVQPDGGKTCEKTFQTNDIQLTNGCYYRAIVVYKTRRKVESTKILFVDKPSYEYKKYGEVYEFYVGYKDAGAAAVSDNEKKSQREQGFENREGQRRL